MQTLLNRAATAIVVMLCLGVTEARAQDVQPLFTEANDAYREGRYEEAVRGYESILAGGQATAAVYFNLGNALLKSQRPAQALWAYLNARALAGSDPDVRANLEYARSLLPAAALEHAWRPALPVQWLTLRGRWTTRSLAIVWIVTLWIACGAWIAAGWAWPGHATLRRAARAGTLAAVAALTISAAQTAGIDQVAQSVIVAEDAEVRFAPQPSGTVHYTLTEGTVVRVLQQQHGWTQVQRGDGRAGWLNDEAAAPLLRGASAL